MTTAEAGSGRSSHTDRDSVGNRTQDGRSRVGPVGTCRWAQRRARPAAICATATARFDLSDITLDRQGPDRRGNVGTDTTGSRGRGKPRCPKPRPSPTIECANGTSGSTKFVHGKAGLSALARNSIKAAVDKPKEASNNDVEGGGRDRYEQRSRTDPEHPGCPDQRTHPTAGAASRPYWVSDRLAAFGRERIMVSAALVNRRSEAGKKVVDLSRWYTGDGVLFRDALSHASATGTPIPLSSSRL